MFNKRHWLGLLFLSLQSAASVAHFVEQEVEDGADIADDFEFFSTDDLEDGALGYFHPEVHYTTYEEGEEPSLLLDFSLQDSGPDDHYWTSALNFVRETLQVEAHQIAYQSGYSRDDVHYIYVAQAHDGVPFANAVANLAIHQGHVVSFGSSFVKPTGLYPASTPTVPLRTAIANAERHFSGAHNGHPAAIKYLARSDDSVALVYTIQIQNAQAATWVEAHVDAHSGAVLSSVNYVAESSYTAVPIYRQSILEAARRIDNPQSYDASPLGWHHDGKHRRTQTQGNNVMSRHNGKTSKHSSWGQNYHYHYDMTQPPNKSIDASRVNAFYVMNVVHDFTYLYGFTEEAYNFQHYNLGLGGKELDPVLVDVQDPTRVNNAYFMTPPDGQSGEAHFHIFYGWYDAAMDNSVVVHEYTHGITNRMTGGGTASCLQTIQARGMGEGWSDAMAEWTEQRGPTIKDFILGVYVVGNYERGIRHYPYSVDRRINPLLYSHLNKLKEEHAIGQIWANVLHQVLTSLVQRHGFSPNARHNPYTLHGNVVFLHLFLDALALQPCNPNFLQARDAWFRADKNRYRGRHRCILWRAFAARGMGVDARGGAKPPFRDGFKVPKGC
ncbi:Fungalysin metallopeptidase-domain-containing protein [Panaeolus papilionaceus]|nr:Fungalysin metallopeptidase-domain-containing protein [Panaeolus papilionaceus]